MLTIHRPVTHGPHLAFEVIARKLQGNKKLVAAAVNARVMPSVPYTDFEVAWVGLTEDSGLVHKASRSRRACSLGRHRAARLPIGRDEGITKLLFDGSPEAHGHGKILGESIGMAAEIAHGSCTDVPPQKK